jgi:hypothetical protein
MTTPAKTNLFSQVSSTYQHQKKWVRPGPALVTSDVYLKWSLIKPESLPITPSQVNEAQAFLLEELSSGRLKLHNEVGFVVQHRCAKVLILYVCTWRATTKFGKRCITLPLSLMPITKSHNARTRVQPFAFGFCPPCCTNNVPG